MQFCINFVNEKLQQIFIELTLKAEQVRYEIVMEFGIEREFFWREKRVGLRELEVLKKGRCCVIRREAFYNRPIRDNCVLNLHQSVKQ